MNRKKVAHEGFGPAYDNRGDIIPGFEGLGPARWEDKEKQFIPAKHQRTEKKEKPKVKPKTKTYPSRKKEPVKKPGTKRYFA